MITDYQINLTSLLPETCPPSLIWKLSNLDVCCDLIALKKNSHNAEEMKRKFIDHIRLHSNAVHLYTDGSKSPEGVGYAYCGESVQIAKRIQPDATVFTAELYAIYDCISYINESNQDHFVIFSDSRCALLALQKYLNPNPQVQMIQCHIHSSPKEIKLCWVPSHVGVPLNEVADELAKGAVTNQNVTTVNLSRSDYRRVMKYTVTHKWREKWNHIENN